MRVLFTMSYNNRVLNVIPTLYEGYIVSVHRMVIENCPVDPGSIQVSHRSISLIRIKHKHTGGIFVKMSINDHIVVLVHENHIKMIPGRKNKHAQRTCLMY